MRRVLGGSTLTEGGLIGQVEGSPPGVGNPEICRTPPVGSVLVNSLELVVGSAVVAAVVSGLFNLLIGIHRDKTAAKDRRAEDRHEQLRAAVVDFLGAEEVRWTEESEMMGVLKRIYTETKKSGTRPDEARVQKARDDMRAALDRARPVRAEAARAAARITLLDPVLGALARGLNFGPPPGFPEPGPGVVVVKARTRAEAVTAFVDAARRALGLSEEDALAGAPTARSR